MTRGQPGSSILDNVHNVETPLSGGSLIACANPLCANRFKPGGMKAKPKRFCSGDCRQFSSLIKRVRERLKGLTDGEIVRVIRG